MNSSNKTIILIPARIASTRLPNKPLLKIDGKEMILKVWESAQMSNADLVMVATDSAEIADILSKNNAKYFITKNEHVSGTDRIHEVLTRIDPD